MGGARKRLAEIHPDGCKRGERLRNWATHTRWFHCGGSSAVRLGWGQGSGVRGQGSGLESAQTLSGLELDPASPVWPLCPLGRMRRKQQRADVFVCHREAGLALPPFPSFAFHRECSRAL